MFDMNDIMVEKTQGKQQIELYFHSPLFLEHLKNLCIIEIIAVRCIYALLELKLLNDALL